MSEAVHTILVVDDDRSVRTSLERALTFEGYDVVVAADGVDAIERLDDSVGAVVLDVSMPNMDGLEVCRRVRASGNDVPILLLTARHSTADRVVGLDSGADDYLVKPFALEELLARIRVMLRRVEAPGSPSDALEFEDLRLDRGTRLVHRGDRRIDLTRTEFELLEVLMEHPGQVLSRDQLYEGVWGYDSSTSSNSLEVYIGYLRKKIEDGGEPRIVHTVRGVGYVVRSA